MKRPTNRNPQKGEKPVIVIVEREQRERNDTEYYMCPRLLGYEVHVIDWLDPESILIRDKHIDLIVITTLFHERSTKVRRVVSNASIACPEAQFIIFAGVAAEDPKDARARTIIQRNNYDALASAIREKVPLKNK